MSTYLDYSVKTLEEFKTWILAMLGEPLVTVELTNDQLDVCINNALELFTKYVSQDEEYYVCDLSGYTSGVGIVLPSNVVSVFAMEDSDVTSHGNVATLFSIPNSMWNAGVLPQFSGKGTGGWITFELALEYLKFIKKFIGGGGFTFNYNPRNKMLKLVPDPIKEKITGKLVLGCWVIRDESMQYGEYWVKHYALAEAKIMLGTIRSKFSGVQLLGGGQVDTSIKADGIAEREKLREELRRQESTPYGFFAGW